MRKSLVLIGFSFAMVGSSLAATVPATNPAAAHTQPQSVPRYFEENRGQWPVGQAFRAYGYGFGVSLAKDGVTLQVANPKDAKPLGKGSQKTVSGAASSAKPPREVSLRFEGASTSAQLTGLDELAAKGAWFQGAQANWHSDIPLFERVREEQVYPGVSATFYGRDGQLEYDLDVAPGAKAGALVFDLDGADRATIGKNGDLTIEVNSQQLVLHKPLAWQPDGQNRRPVEVSYVLLPSKGRNGQRIGLGLEGYNASKPLTIDPVLTFATYLSSAASTLPDYYLIDLAIDSSNNVYVLSMDSGESSMTVQKLTSAGALVYTATFSTSSNATALRVNASGEAYVAATAVAGYPTTSTAYQKTYPNHSYSGNYNAAFSVLSANGSTLVYSTYFGGTENGSYGPDYGNALAVDSSGNAYLAGQAGGGNFPTTAGAYQTTYTSGHPTGFVAKFNPSASGTASLVYSTLIGGANTDVSGVAVDGAGDAYLSISSPSCNAPVTAGAFAYSGIDVGSNCGNVTAVNPTGTGLVYSAYLGPATPESLAVDGSDDVYVTGLGVEADDFPATPGAYQTSYPQGFALELNPTGGLIYSTFLSGPSGATDIGGGTDAVDPFGIALVPGCVSACTAYIAGATNAADFPVINGLSGAPPASTSSSYYYEHEGFLVALNGTGSAALTSGYLSGLNTYLSSSSVTPDTLVGFMPHVAVDSNGNAWLEGQAFGASGPDFPVTTTATPTTTGSWLAEVSMTNAGNVIPVPNILNFGTSVPVNVSSTLYDASISTAPTTIALRNLGSAQVTFNSVVASPAYFTESDNCNGHIAASSYCTVTIVFTPPNDTPVTGTLTIASNGLNSPLVVPLSGQGSDNGFILASPSTLSFGNVTVNTASAPQTVTMTNMGDEPAMNLNTVFFNGNYTNSLNGFNGVTDCPASLPPGDNCQVQVIFAPNESEVGPEIAILDNYYYYYYGYANSVSVTGTGVLPTSAGGTQSVALSATTLNFGTEAVGASSGYQYIYLTNTGSQTLNFLTPTVAITSSQGSAADFQVSGYGDGGGTNPQGSNDFSVTFTPSAAGTETATLTIPIAGSSTVYAVSLVGQGMANTQTLEFQPGNAIFPDQPVGTASAAQTFDIFNAGNTPFVVDRVLGSGDFSVSYTSCPGDILAPAYAPGAVVAYGYCSVSVVFTPSQTGSRTGTLTVIDAASATPQTIPLAGNGITAAGVFTATPTTLDFGLQVKGTSSSVQYLTLTNSGNIPINFTAAATTGDYAITYNNCGIPYTAGPNVSFCTIGVTFTPTVTTSPDNGTLILTTSAGSQTITLTGGGEAGTLASGLSPTSANFGQDNVTANSVSVPFYVRNSGTETLTFSTAATVTGDFYINYDNCNTGSSGTLAPGQDCMIPVTFAATASGSRTGTLTVKSNAGTLTASLSGTGIAISSNPTYFQPPAGSFDQQAVNSISGPITFNFGYGGTLSNFALTGASITAGSADFQLASGANALNTCTAAQGSGTTCQVNVVFSPTASGYHTGTLTVTSNAGSFSTSLAGYAPAVSDGGYLSPGALVFPSQVMTTTSTYQQIYLYNTGAAAMTVGAVTGGNYGPSSEFSVYTNNPAYDYCSGQVLAPADSTTPNGGSCYVLVQFSPSAAGTRTGTIAFPVTYADGTTGTFTANLTGIGVAQYNEAVLSPTIATFPDIAVGTINSSYYQYIYLTNSGNLAFNVGQLTSNNVVIGTTTTGDFNAATPYGYDSCSNTSIAAGSSCYILSYFTPQSAGGRTGTVTFPVTYANASTPVNFKATLTGNGIAANPAIAVSPAGIQFDTVTVNAGSPGNDQPITATNTGNVPITFTKATITTGFTLESDGCTGYTINPGTACTDYVYFNPTTAKTYTGTLNLTDNAAGSPQAVALSGTSLAATSELEFSQTTVSFGNQTLNTASSQVTVNLINHGTDAVTVSSIALAGTDPGDYSESDNCAGSNLAANSTCQIYLTFTPTATGSRTATLTETDSGAGGPRSVTISGSGINASTAITFFPAALTFSSAEPAGEGSPQQFFSVTNIGVNPVTITAVSSTNAAAFNVAQNGCTGNTLTTGQSCLIIVLFTPASAASDTGYIKVTDNASGSPQELPVSGTGIAQLTSAVTLTATPTSAAYGSLFTLSAAVKDQNSNPVSNGRVTFYDGTTMLGTTQVATTTSGGGVIGTATLKTILVPLGSNSITATYVGSDATSTSTAVSVTVTGTYPTTTAFTSSGSAGDYTFTGTVLGMGPVAPTGTVTFTDNTTGLVPGTAEINAGTLAQTFVAAPTITGINPPDVVAFADLNGDGIPDLVTGTETNGLVVQLGNGDGTFQAPNSVSAGGLSSQNYFGILTGTNVVFGDFNGDGKTDIAFVECTNGSSSCAAGVLLGNGDGTFQKERYYDQSGVITGIAVGDFNGNGILDIAVANYGNGTVDLMLGNGDGTFQEPVSISMPGADSVAAGDLIGNGKLDLVIGNWGYGTVSVLLGNGNGTFQTAASYSTPVSAYPNNATLASLRSNGKLDIVLQDYDYGASVLLVNSNGTFGAATAVFSPSSPSYLESLAVADINGDGKPDLIAIDAGTGNVDVLLGNGSGTFQGAATYATGTTPIGVAIADINHDGRPDIAVANQSGPSDTILLNHVTRTAVLTPTLAPGSGTHSVSGAYSGDANFAASTSNTLSLVASLITPTMTLGASPSATTTSWGQQLTLNVTLAGAYGWVPVPTGSVSYSIDGGSAQPATLTSGSVAIPVSQLSVGNHSIAVSYGGDQYYTNLAAQTLPITIIKANQTITFNALAGVTYGVSPITLSATSTSGLAVTFSVTSGPGTISGTNSNILTITGAGTVVVAANQAGNADYNAAPPMSQSLAVAQAPLTVTVNSASKAYGAALPTFSGTIIGLVNGDTLTATYSSTGTASSPVGTYPITATLSGSALPNYSPTITPGTLTITKVALTVTANNASRIYNTANPTFTDTIAGFVNGDTQSVVGGAASLTTTATLSSAVGTYPITAALGTLSATNYTFSFVNGMLTITQATPTISWTSPAAITYGTALSATQLDASSTVAGSFVYTPASGAALTAGTQTLSVTLTPTDTTDYTTATKTVSLTVNKATPTISWTTPAAITYGTALSATQLDATSTVAGAFVYSPASGTVLKAGSQTLSVTFTPTDTTDYTTATDTVTLTVNQVTPTITWATPAAITYGTALSTTQLDASSTVAGSFAYTPVSGTVLATGTHTLSVTLTPTDTTDYTTATATVTLTVNPATPTISWTAPAAITYGTALSATQLDASSTVAGSFAYTPASGTVLPAGSHTLSVTLTPTDTTDYTTATATVTLIVNKATPTISWTAPAAITYGTALSATQLDASSTVAGSFAYTPASGTVLPAGSHTLSVTLTPTDSTDYTTATATGTLTVNQATPTISWTAPAAITYGTALSATQLDASSTVAGSFAYTPASGTVLTGGSQTLSVTLTPTDTTDYTTATDTVALTVKQAAQTITFPAITSQPALSTVTLSATASSGLTVSYTSLTTSICSVTGNTASLLESGTCNIKATQPGNVDYAAATAVSQSITVTHLAQTITFPAIPATTLVTGSVSLNATASSGLTVNFTSLTTSVCSVTGNTASLLETGTCTIQASQPGNAVYFAAPAVKQSFTVTLATPTITWATPAAITYGTALSATQLDASSTVAGSFAYTPASGTVLTAGTHTLSVTLTPTDTTDYTTATATVTLTVNKATPTITWTAPVAITYGTALSATQLDASSTVAGSFAYTPASGTVLAAGSQTLSVTLTPTDTTDYTTATATATLPVSKATLTVTANNTGRAYDTANPTFTDTLTGFVNGDTQSVVSGAASLTTTATLTSTVGSYPITAAQGTLSASNYTFTFVNGTLTVNQATPTISWTAPAAITYGTALSATQLDASSTVAGSFAYTPASGTVLTGGSQTLSVTLTPTDTTDYTTATDTVALTVKQAAQTITFPAITSQPALSTVTLSATASSGLTVSYTSLTTSICSVTGNTASLLESGTCNIKATQPGNVDYAAATAVSQSITVTHLAQTITFPAIPATTLVTGSVSLNATASSGLTVNFTSLTTSVCSVTGNTASLLETGTCTIQASQPGNAVYFAAPAVKQSFTVTLATPTITWATPAAITYGTALSATQLDASSTVAGSFAYTPASGTVLTAGTHTLSVTLTPTDTTDYTTATATVTLTVNKATPTITWTAPVAITYGTALSATQLDASSTVAGSFAYTPASGTVLAAGSQTLSVTLTPTDTTDYTTATATATLPVSKATLTVTANNTGRAYDTANPTFTDTLTGFVNGDTQSVVSGAASLTTTATLTSTVGSYPITAAQGTLSASNYTFTFVNGTLTVNQATPTISWTAPAAITYGTALSATQLDASSTVAGSFAYTPASGTVLTGGSQTLSVTLTPTDTTDYTTATDTVALTVKQAAQTITFPAITSQPALSTVTLSATASSGLTVSYTSLTTSICSVTGNTASLLESGTCNIKATQPGNVDYAAATAVSQSITVTHLAQTITFPAIPATTLVTGSVSLNATASSGLTVNFTSLTTSVCSVTGNTASLLETGTCTIQASQPGNAVYFAAPAVKQSFTVTLATPTITWATPAAITYGTALSATQLDASSTVAGSFAYTPASGTVLTAGTHTLSVTLTPTDTTDYTTATATVTLTVNKATPTITWTAPVAITYGTALSATQLDASSTVAGSFAYTPASGTVLAAGSQTLSVTLTPTDTTDYTTATKTVTLTVKKATPTITWTAPAAITYGTALSATQLDATSTVAGSFAYTPASGTVLAAGSQTLSVTLTPTDTTDYTTATATVQLTVNPAPAISLPAASSNPLGPGVVSYVYGSGLQASGGSGNYTFVVNGTTIPTTGAYTAASSSGGLTFSANGSNTLTVSGTPTSAQTVSLAVEAIDSNNNSDHATVTYSVPVTTGPSGANNANLKGTYTCLIHGYNDADGSKFGLISSVVADGNGNLTGGVFDANGVDQTAESQGTFTGTYSLGSDNNGLATVNGTNTVGATGTFTNIWALAATGSTSPANEFRMVLVNDTGAAPSGQHGQADCLLDTTSAFTSSTISGKNFIFDFSGADSGGRPHVTAGRFDASGGSITTGYVDQAKGGNTTLTSGSITSGSYTAPNSTTGRYLLTITTSTGSLTSAVYIVNSGEAFQISTAADDGIEEGHVFTQALSSFSNANLSGNAVVYLQGYEFTNSSSPDTVTGTYSEVFEATGNGSSGLTINQSYMDDDGSYSAGNANGTTTATFDTTNPGRLTVNTGAGSTTVVYLANTNAGIELSVGGGANSMDSGFIESQTQATFTDAALAGDYMIGLLPVEGAMKHDTVGEFDVTSSGTATAGASSGGQGVFNYDQAQSYDYSFDSTAPGTGAFLLTNGDGSCAVITSTRAVCTSQSDSVGTILVLQK